MTSNQPGIEQMGKALREIRDRAKKSQEDAAKTLGVTRVAVSNYERGMLPEDFMTEKLPRLATLYGVSPQDVVNVAYRNASHISSWQIPDDEPIANHVAKFPVSVQVWFHAFLSELLNLGLRQDISAGAVERARAQMTFGQVDLWAGGDLLAADPQRTLQALRWCAEAAWRNVTEPGWLRRPRSQWGKLPSIFDARAPEEVEGGPGGSSRPKGRRAAE